MNLSGELVTITDQSGYVLRVNNTCEKIMGLKKSEFEGKSVIDLEKNGNKPLFNYKSSKN